MPEHEPLPYAPLVERCFELAVDISAEQFEEHAGAFMAAVGTELGLSEHKTIEHWEIRIDKPKGGLPPKPKATLYNVPTVSHPEKSVRGDSSVETVHLIPPTERGPSRLKYAQLKPQTGLIMPFEDAKRHLHLILTIFEDTFITDGVLQICLNYWNDLYRFDDSYFQPGSIFNLSRTLRYFNETKGMGTLVPPWNISMNWEAPSLPGALLHLDLKAEWTTSTKQSIQNQLLAVLAYLGKLSPQGVPASDCLIEVEKCHVDIYEKFVAIFTPEALEYCKHGSIDKPASKA